MRNTPTRPYQLPSNLTCNSNEAVTIDLVNKYIDKHEQRFVRYNYLEALYRGFHDVYKGPEKPEWKPDWRLSVNFPKYITDTFLGYAYGIPVKKSHPDDGIDKAIKAFEDNNEIEDHENEMEKYCCIYGHAYEYFYQDENTQTKLNACNPKDMFVVYDDKIKSRAMFAVRYGYHGKEKHIRYGEILTKEEIKTFDNGKIIDSRVNPYGKIPVVEWMLNSERIGLYEEVSGMVEAYNHTLGEKANDVDAFAEAYLAVLGAELDEDGVYKIRENRIINLYGTDDAKDILVQFLQKPTADGTQENLLDRLETLIYQISMVANISDDSFGSTTSGTSLAYKLQAMSNLAMTFDRKIKKSLKKRYKLFCSLSTNVNDPEAWRNVEITTTRNIPKNYLDEAQTAQALSGIVSHETQLKVLSMINNPKDELDLIEKEEEKTRNALSQSLFHGYGLEEDDE